MGLTGRASDCTENSRTAVYTRLTHYFEWFESVLRVSLTTTTTTEAPRPPPYACNKSITCGCGPADVSLSAARIVGGENAIEDSWPMAISLRLNGNDNHVCGGTILSPSLILTAAHCLHSVDSSSPSGLTIAAGVTNRSDSTRVIRSVDRLYVHPLYNASARNYRHDIALLHLAQPLPIGDNERMTRSCLQHLNASTMRNGTHLAIVGWGMIRFNVTVIPEILKQADIYAIDQNDGGARQQHIGFFDRSRGENLDFPTVIDLGAGIFEWAEGYWQQIGILPQQEIPTPDRSGQMYTRLSHYYEWIREVLQNGAEQIETSPTWDTAHRTTQKPDPTIYGCQVRSRSCGCSMNNVVASGSSMSDQSHHAYPHSWSMMVSVRLDRLNHTCEGTILSDSFILTAAHCVSQFNEFGSISIVAGIHTLSDAAGAIHRQVDRVFPYPTWTHDRPHLHDIALLHLHDPLPMESLRWRLKKTCVSADQPLESNATFMTVGWDPSPMNDVLQQSFVRLISSEDQACSSATTDSQYQFCASAKEEPCNPGSTAAASIFLYRNTHWEQVRFIVQALEQLTPVDFRSASCRTIADVLKMVEFDFTPAYHRIECGWKASSMNLCRPFLD